MNDPRVQSAIESVSAGAWAVGVSGGADSVALLAMLRGRSDLRLHVVHLDHQTRGAASTGDAKFVVEFAKQWGLPATAALRESVEPKLIDPPANASALYRACRLELYREVVESERLQGVILAHHADDQAETVLQRLIRGSSWPGLAGMCRQTVIRGLTILRPLLSLRRAQLREYLVERGLTWREDASNQSDAYLRNRLRRILGDSPRLFQAMIELGEACAGLRDWVRQTAPELAQRFNAGDLARVPRILADESGRRWLADRGVPIDQIDSAAIDRLRLMAADAASPARQDFPGPLTVRRRAGVIFAGP